MGYAGYYIASTLFFVIYLGLSWVVTGWLHLTGPAETAVRSILTALGFGVYGYILYFLNNRHAKQRQQGDGTQGTAPATGGVKEEMDILFRHAEAKLAAARLGKDAKLRNFPVFFLLGNNGSAKTSTFVNSGIEPDLLGGQVYQAQEIVSTRPANIWLARNSVFVEAGGGLVNSPVWWIQLIKRLQPGRWRALFERKKQAARGAVVCVDAETFLKPGADDALAATARNLNARLGEISQTLGIRLPVYVLFTRLDRLSCFLEFSGNLADTEVNQVLGVTLPMRDASRGVYAEEEARRLTDSFNDLFHALCDKRPTLLLREHEETKLAKVYEFPREFRKLRTSLVRFLVDLGKPSQLRVNPFLRGFYFSGVRPRVVNEAVAAGRVREAALPSLEHEASGIFDADVGFGRPAVLPTPTASVRTRRVPQWLFLGHLFSGVILEDRNALGASSTSAGTQTLRRVGLTVGALLFAGWALASTISWSNNQDLENRALTAARGIGHSESGGAAQALPSSEALEHLDVLRDSVERIYDLNLHGHPWSMGWGLYVGHTIYPTVSAIYFARFDQLLFGSTQRALEAHLSSRPPRSPPDEAYSVYETTYNTLRAFLITTEDPQFSTPEFLSRVLFDYWSAGRTVDPHLAQLARRQFDFYSKALLTVNPFPGRENKPAVETARTYLASFSAVDRYYNFLIRDVSNKTGSVNFNHDFPKSATYIVNNRDMRGAFTAKGWALVQERIDHLGKDFGGEKWVLGDVKVALDPTTLGPELRKRYEAEFIDEWRKYLKASSVVRYGSAKDAAEKLGQLSTNESFLMQLFCVVTNNTNVSSDAVKAPYQPVYKVEPPGCSAKLATDVATPYLRALQTLQTQLGEYANNRTDQMAAAQASHRAATEALDVVKGISLGFQVDTVEPKVDAMVTQLLKDPITYADATIGNPELGKINGEAKSVCDETHERLARLYPFKTDATAEATLEDTDHFFRPNDGTLARFWESTLKNYAEKIGDRYEARRGGPVRVDERFMTFFNHAMEFSRALYKDGPKAHINFAMRPLATHGVQSITLIFDGQKFKWPAAGGEFHDFVWPGPGKPEARLVADAGGDKEWFRKERLWAVFRFFGGSNHFDAVGNYYRLEWTPLTGGDYQPATNDDKSQFAFPFELDLKGAPPVFRKGYLAGMDCPPGIPFH